MFISDLISNSGDFYAYVDFLNKYGINASKRDYTILTNSIPLKLLFLIKSYKIYCNLCLIIPRLFIQGVNIMDNKCTNKFLRNFVTANNASSFKAYRKWLALYPNVHFQKVWTVPNKFLFNNKIKEVHFKIIHHYYPCNKYLSKFIQNLSPLCSFCQEEEKSLSHLFYFCPYTKQFWLQISASLLLVFFRLCNISAVKVLFHSVVSDSRELEDVLDFICMMGKFHIHKARCLNFKPNCQIFSSDLLLLYSSLQRISSNKKALKTSNIIKKLINKL